MIRCRTGQADSSLFYQDWTLDTRSLIDGLREANLSIDATQRKTLRLLQALLPGSTYILTSRAKEEGWKSSWACFMIIRSLCTGGTMAEPSYEELRARVAELEKQKPGRKGGQLEFRVGEKGGVSVYGLGRFPVTLYYEQWVRLLDAAGDLRAFLEENKSEGKLKLKEK
jgi:hypothetical protein